MKRFSGCVWCCPASPLLILIDNHDSHISLPVIDSAKEHGIIMVSFPPHCSHKLQPLDHSVYGPFKKYYNVACDNWMVNNPGCPMTIYDIPRHLLSATSRLDSVFLVYLHLTAKYSQMMSSCHPTRQTAQKVKFRQHRRKKTTNRKRRQPQMQQHSLVIQLHLRKLWNMSMEHLLQHRYV